jgi:ketosteroid isomerase-like protein
MDLEEIKAIIQESNQKFGDAIRHRNAPGLAALYTQDATIMPSNGEMIKGEDGVKMFAYGAMQMMQDIILTSSEVQAMGEYYCEIGKFWMRGVIQGDETFEDNGKYVVIWKLEEGTWKMYIDIWNSSLPPQ